MWSKPKKPHLWVEHNKRIKITTNEEAQIQMLEGAKFLI